MASSTNFAPSEKPTSETSTNIDASPGKPIPISGPFVGKVFPWNYHSHNSDDMENWICERLCPDAPPNIPTKVLQFRLPQDSLKNSGILRLLDIVPELLRSTDVPTLLQEELSIDDIMLPIHLFKAKQRLRAYVAAKRGVVEDVPLWVYLTALVDIFGVCEQVETIEVPMEWAETFEWEEGVFPKVDRQQKTVLEGGAVRWGKEPEKKKKKKRKKMSKHEAQDGKERDRLDDRSTWLE